MTPAPRRKPVPKTTRVTSPRTRKPKAEVEPLDNVEGFWQTFGPSDEHLLAGTSIVVLTLDRRTGIVEVDDALSTPLECAGMLLTASCRVNGAVDRANGLYED